MTVGPTDPPDADGAEIAELGERAHRLGLVINDDELAAVASHVEALQRAAAEVDAWLARAPA